MADQSKGLVKCLACGYMNVAGEDVCAECDSDLHLASEASGLSRELGEIPVKTLPIHPAITIPLKATVAEAVARMVEGKHGEVLVMDGAKLVGIVTERDITERVLSLSRDMKKLPVKSIMTGNVETVTEEDPLAVAMNKMAVRSCRHLPVMKGETCAGILSVREVIDFLTSRV